MPQRLCCWAPAAQQQPLQQDHTPDLHGSLPASPCQPQVLQQPVRKLMQQLVQKLPQKLPSCTGRAASADEQGPRGGWVGGCRGSADEPQLWQRRQGPGGVGGCRKGCVTARCCCRGACRSCLACTAIAAKRLDQQIVRVTDTGPVLISMRWLIEKAHVWMITAQ